VDELSELQNAHRLAIHTWENQEHYAFPEFSWDALHKHPARDIQKRLFDNTMPVVSMSLLPRQESGISLRPYNIFAGDVRYGSYLIDMSQDQRTPPRVMRALERGLVSGTSVSHKKLKLRMHSRCSALNDFYEGFGEDESKLRLAIAGRQGSHHTNTQLDALGSYYDWLGQLEPKDRHISSLSLFLNDEQTIADFNEILVAASTSHIKAIAIPFMQDAKHDQEWYPPAQKLAGAIAGLQHLRKGIDLPVVYYHVTPLDQHTNHQGQCTYLAQGEAELITAALTACKELEKQHIVGEPADSPTMRDVKQEIGFEPLRDAVKELLNGLDIEQPLAAQHAAKAALDNRIQQAEVRKR